jgi:non-ribosomal peptide synthase protein (TIGR01720 family)
VIYPSGSTGRPKGVPITHASLFNLVCWHQETYQVSPADRATQIAGPAFDASVWEIWPYLTAGASVHIPDTATRLDAGRLVRWLVDRRVTLTFLPTPLAESVLRESWPEATPLRVLLTGGDRLKQAPARNLPFRLVNHYGPTENTVVSTFAEVDEGSNAAPPIGRPLANTQAYVLDRHLQPVPVGVPGQLHVGGVQLAPGYWNRPDLTADKFIPNPFRGEPEARLYQTGDLVRWRPDGNIDFLGRIDNQVKIRGFRIELGEIEATLDRHPAVRQSLVLVREDAPGRTQLVAYVRPESGAVPAVHELRAHLKESLPEVMVPSAVVLLDAFPLTPNGKIDRNALPAIDVSAGIEAPFVAPQTPNETILANIWSQALRVDRVGVHDKFFELGGDSILGMQVVAKANQAGLRLTLSQMFQHQTIAELALVAENTTDVASDGGPVTGDVPLTPIQQWFFEQNFADAHHWNQAVMLELWQTLDPALVELAIRQLIAHHDALRLRFSRHEEGWRQFNAAADDTIALTRKDLSGFGEAEQHSAMQDALAELQARLNLAEGPLVGAALFDLGPRRRPRLLVVIHHLAVDTVSWRILLEDLQAVCSQLVARQAIRLPRKTSPFKLWAERLREYARTSTFEREAEYWLAASPAQASTLPVDFARGTNSEASVSTVSVVLEAENTRALLQRVPHAYKTQINDVLLSALGLALSHWIGQPSVTIDLEGHGREGLFDDIDLSRTVGWFTTIFPLRLDLPDAGPGDVLKSVKEQLRRVPQRGIGYGLLRYLSTHAAAAELRTRPQPQVVFNYLGQFDQTLTTTPLFAWAPESMASDHSPRACRSHVLEINGGVVAGTLRLDWRYSQNVHRHVTIERVAARFLEELRTLIHHCLSPEAGGYTPSDFAEAGLNQEELDRLISDLSEQHVL